MSINRVTVLKGAPCANTAMDNPRGTLTVLGMHNGPGQGPSVVEVDASSHNIGSGAFAV